MFFLISLLRFPRRPSASRHGAPLFVERLEDRFCPSGGYLLVGSYDTSSVLRYDESTGAFVDQFDPHNLANLKDPVGGVVAPDHSLYVSSNIFSRSASPTRHVSRYSMSFGLSSESSRNSTD